MNRPEMDAHGMELWNETAISSPKQAIPDASDYLVAHYGSLLSGGKRRRIELLVEYDVDRFWCQFVEPTQRPVEMPAPSEGGEKRSDPQANLTGLRQILLKTLKSQPQE
jgi:hypothetical protein